MLKMKFALVASLLFCATTVFSADTPADIDLRLAAKLHKGGDTPAAVSIWKKWAQQGNVDAAYNLAVIHQHADGVGYDAGEALRWYRQAAERGDKISQFQLGLMYQNGEGVPADQAKAHEWFTKNRRDHVHHHHNPQFQQWQKQALGLIEERDRREAAANAKRDGVQILAELKRRAAMVAEAPGAMKVAAAAAY
ncbi:MAG: tetratricopeptide repeat protein [Rhodocyclaceae bacterium]|nr:tetratricopeptide repeat protein [Rhodocyclaceae bacterium]